MSNNHSLEKQLVVVLEPIADEIGVLHKAINDIAARDADRTEAMRASLLDSVAVTITDEMAATQNKLAESLEGMIARAVATLRQDIVQLHEARHLDAHSAKTLIRAAVAAWSARGDE